MASQPKRKRIKLQCEECNSTFDDDYRTKHELKYHSGRRTRVKTVGAPINPFFACVQPTKKKTPDSNSSLSTLCCSDVVCDVSPGVNSVTPEAELELPNDNGIVNIDSTTECAVSVENVKNIDFLEAVGDNVDLCDTDTFESDEYEEDVLGVAADYVNENEFQQQMTSQITRKLPGE
jgi:hypothetical protein